MISRSFICGVAEGFYGRPWSSAQRTRLFGWMEQWGLNTYLYAPKDDLKHRTRWRELYDEAEANELARLIQDCQARQIEFIYAIAPGLDYDSAASSDEHALHEKTKQIVDLGCSHFALLYDDLDALLANQMFTAPESVAHEQAATANRLWRALKTFNSGAVLIFCPTEYCARKAMPSVKNSAYLRTLGVELDPAIGFFWTGPEIISETISVESIRELREVIRRKPILWDNLHANDYDLRRIYLGPYSGRSLALRDELSGILSNPNCEFEANYVPLRTLAAYAQAAATYEPHTAYLEALSEWQLEWKTAGPVITGRELELLADCLHLPNAFGPSAATALASLARHFRAQAHVETAQRFREFIAEYDGLFQKMPALINRDLFHSLLRHAWELNEELQLLKAYLDWQGSSLAPGATFFSAHHRPGIYRGGFVATLQRLLPMDDHGVLRHDQAARLNESIMISPPFKLRRAEPRDEPAAYDVCVQTGDNGRGAAHLYPDDPRALGRIFVGPYLAMEPDLAFVLEDDQGVCGYLLGALDSRKFFDA
ncbi:MAG: beta-N-acetylglucosaminidase domain-containing protein, partial [Verrucomicrobiota bacterium]